MMRFSTGDTITTDEANFIGNWASNDGAKGTVLLATTPVGNFQTNGFRLRDSAVTHGPHRQAADVHTCPDGDDEKRGP